MYSLYSALNNNLQKMWLWLSVEGVSATFCQAAEDASALVEPPARAVLATERCYCTEISMGQPGLLLRRD